MRAFKTVPTRPAIQGAVLLLALTAGASAQDALSPHDRLAVWAGHWKRHGEVRETQFGPARTFDYDVRCSFLPHDAFMACSSVSLMPDPNHGNRVANTATLFYYSDFDRAFKYTEVHPEGGPSEGTARVEGNVWTEPREIQRRSGGTADGRFVYHFVAPDRMEARFEISTDRGGHWTLVDTFVDTKQA